MLPHLYLLLPEQAGHDGDRQRRQQQGSNHGDTLLLFYRAHAKHRVLIFQHVKRLRHTDPSMKIFVRLACRPGNRNATSSPVQVIWDEVVPA